MVLLALFNRKILSLNKTNVAIHKLMLLKSINNANLLGALKVDLCIIEYNRINILTYSVV